MPRKKSIPQYRYHVSGQARVTFCNKDFLLGTYNSAESHSRYQALLQEYQATGSLVTPASLPEWPSVYVDTSGDGKSTVLDALLILNELARTSNDNGEGELTDVAIQNWSHDLSPISSISQRTEQLTQSPSNPSAIFTSTPVVDHYASNARDIDAECQSIGCDSLKTIDESILSLLSE